MEKQFIGQITEYERYGELQQNSNGSGFSMDKNFTMDKTDYKILYLLSQNARFSHTSIAKKLKIKRETVAYRIKRMKKENFFHGSITLINHRKLGLKNYLVYIKLKTIGHEKEMLAYLFESYSVTRLKNCSGSHDLQMIITVKQQEEFVEHFDKFIEKYHHTINHYDISEILEEGFLGLHLLLEPDERKNLSIVEHKGSSFQKEVVSALQNNKQEVVEIDARDSKILELLKLDGAININDISTKINLAPIAIKNRIKRLITTGVIKGFIPLVSLNKLGYHWWKVFFKCKNLESKRFISFLQYHSNVLWYMRLLGKWDYQFSIFARDNTEFHKIIDEIRERFAEHIISYDSIIVFNQFKYVQRIL